MLRKRRLGDVADALELAHRLLAFGELAQHHQADRVRHRLEQPGGAQRARLQLLEVHFRDLARAHVGQAGAQPAKPSAAILASYFGATCAPGVSVPLTSLQLAGFSTTSQPAP